MKQKFLILTIVSLFISSCYLSKDNLFFGAGFLTFAAVTYLASVNPLKITSKK